MDKFGLRIGVEGEKEFKNSLADINRNFRILGSEMKMVESQFEKNDSSVQALSSRNEVLNKQIDAQKEKIETLKAALKNAADSFGENDRRTQNWQIQLNNAEAALNAMDKELKSNIRELENAEGATDGEKKAVKEMGDEADHSSDKLKTLSNVLKATAAVSAATVAAVGAMFIGFSKEVVSAYGDYEQLVGGVETLFKDSSDEVKKYATDAYKTAGLSANEYMETVTGFSASLIESLGGDTKKAAELADQAIIDMSDNANKMGTDMASIQNAYQGFAKQNYTMLDNLKLGYGGTKTEMERLLADAQAISGIEFNIDSYADIVNAIHVIQSEMGITGTTAKEAEATISGSINMTKSALQNLVIGFGNADADIAKLCSDVVSSMTSVVKNIKPVVLNIVGALPEALSSLADPMLDLLVDVVDTLSDSIPSVLDHLFDSILSVMPGLLSTFFTNVVPKLIKSMNNTLPKLANGALQIIKSLISSISKSLPQLMRDLSKVIVEIVKILTDPKNIVMLIGAGAELIAGLTEGIVTGAWELIKSFPDLVSNIWTSFVDLFDGSAQLDGVVESLDEVGGAFEDLSSRAHDALDRVNDKMTSLHAGFDTVDDLSTRLNKLLEDGTIDTSEQAEAKTIIDLISEKVPEFKSTWDELITKDDEGNYSLRKNADLTIEKINDVIAAYKLQAAQTALNASVAELMEQSQAISLERKQAESDMNLAQSQYTEWLSDWLDMYHLSEEQWHDFLNGTLDVDIDHSTLASLQTIWSEMQKQGFMESLASAQLAIEGLDISQQELQSSTESYMDILRVMNGDYMSNFAATLEAIRLGYVDQQTVLDETGLSWDELKDKAEAASTSSEKAVESAWKNMTSTLENGSINWKKYGDDVAFVVGNHEYKLNELKNLSKEDFKDLSGHFNTTDWTSWGDDTGKVTDTVAKAIGTMQIEIGKDSQKTTKHIHGITENIDKNKMGDEAASAWRQIVWSFGGEHGSYLTFYDISKNSVLGLNDGFNDYYARSTLRTTEEYLAKEASDVYARINEIRSPSRRFMRLAKFDIQGLVKGHESMRNEAIRSVKRIADDIANVDFSIAAIDISELQRQLKTLTMPKIDAQANVVDVMNGAFPLAISGASSAPIFNTNVSFGNVTVNDGSDVEDIAHRVSDIIVNDIMVQGGAFA